MFSDHFFMVEPDELPVFAKSDPAHKFFPCHVPSYAFLLIMRESIMIRVSSSIRSSFCFLCDQMLDVIGHRSIIILGHPLNVFF